MLTTLLVIAALTCADDSYRSAIAEDGTGFVMAMAGVAGCVVAIVRINGG